jgi:putative heme-binding domain-containing protein
VRDLHDLLAFLAALRPFVTGDTARGRALFLDEAGRAACVRCHRLGNRGGEAGPEITAVVAIRSSPFLLEAILKPSKHIASGYQAVRVRTLEGRTLIGVVVRETPDSVWLGTADGGYVTLARRAIGERRALDTSLMPDTLGKVLTAKDLGDLMAFLESLR